MKAENFKRAKEIERQITMLDNYLNHDLKEDGRSITLNRVMLNDEIFKEVVGLISCRVSWMIKELSEEFDKL